MPVRHYCTYFDRNYLGKALSLFRSLREHSKGEIKIYAVCMDELSRLVLNHLDLPHVIAVPMHEIEAGDHALLATRTGRTPVEYLWTCTATIILRILQRNPAMSELTYLDADLFFYSDPEVIFTELGSGHVLIHGHRFTPKHEKLVENGIYNVGLLVFKNTPQALTVLEWWRDRCIEWCYAKQEDGKMGDQGYLNDWPERFEGVVVSQNIGVGVGPWNQEQYQFAANSEGVPMVDGKPVVFYHFHQFVYLFPEFICPTPPLYTSTLEIARLIFLPYIRAQVKGLATCRELLAEFNFGFRNPDFAPAPHQMLIAVRPLAVELSRTGTLVNPIDLDQDWVCYPKPQGANENASAT